MKNQNIRSQSANCLLSYQWGGLEPQGHPHPHFRSPVETQGPELLP